MKPCKIKPSNSSKIFNFIYAYLDHIQSHLQQIPYPLSNILNTSLSYHHGLFFFRFVLFDPLSLTSATLSVGSSTNTWATHHQRYPPRYTAISCRSSSSGVGPQKTLSHLAGMLTGQSCAAAVCLCMQLPRPVQRAALHSASPQALALTFFHHVYVMFPEPLEG